MPPCYACLEVVAHAFGASGLTTLAARDRDWRRFARKKRRGEINPTREELEAFAASPRQMWEVRRYVRRLRPNRAANPVDGVGSTLLKKGGPVMWHELAKLHDIRFRDPWKLTPPTHLYYTGIFKGGGKNPLVYKSYRKIGLLPYPTKVDQGCVAYRESVCTDMSETSHRSCLGSRGAG